VSENQSILRKHVLSEVEVLEALNVEIGTLNNLRLERGLPFIRLNKWNRVYLAEDILEWAKQHRRVVQ